MVVRQGEDSHTLWVVLEGKCEVVKHLDALARTIRWCWPFLEPYSHFGEMSFFSPAPHSASVRAQTAVTVLAIDRRDYDDLIRQGIWAAYKLAYNTGRSLSDRLRRMDEWVAELAATIRPAIGFPMEQLSRQVVQRLESVGQGSVGQGGRCPEHLQPLRAAASDVANLFSRIAAS